MGLLTEMLKEAFADKLNEALDMKDICKKFNKLGATSKDKDWNDFMNFVKQNCKVITKPDMTKVATIQFMIGKKSGRILEIILSRPGINDPIDGIAQVDFYSSNTFAFKDMAGYKKILKEWKGNNPVTCYELPLDIAKSAFPRSVLRNKIPCAGYI